MTNNFKTRSSISYNFGIGYNIIDLDRIGVTRAGDFTIFRRVVLRLLAETRLQTQVRLGSTKSPPRQPRPTLAPAQFTTSQSGG